MVGEELNLKTMLRLFLSTLFVLFNCIFGFAQVTNEFGLSLGGNAKKISIEVNKAKNYVAIETDVQMTLTNNGEKHLILVNPKYYEQDIKTKFAFTQEELEDEGFYLSDSFPTRSFTIKENEVLAKKLDSKKPPSNYTLVLKPKEKIVWNDTILSIFNTIDLTENMIAPRQTFWQSGDKLLLSFSYSLPWDINYIKPKLIEKLPKRWKKIGVFPITCSREEKCKNREFEITTDPIILDFSKAEVKNVS